MDPARGSDSADLQDFRKRMMGLEPTTFCMAIGPVEQAR